MEGVASARTSGTSDNAVSATVVRTKVPRGRRANRRSSAAMPRPTSEKTAVSMAKPVAGMGSPEMSRLIPAAWPAAATTAVATLAAAAAATPASSIERVVGLRSAAVGFGTVVVMMSSDALRTGPCSGPSPDGRTHPRRDRQARGMFLPEHAGGC